MKVTMFYINMKSNLVGVDSILELFFAYLKQYNFHFIIHLSTSNL